jgi:hypothetical protein
VSKVNNPLASDVSVTADLPAPTSLTPLDLLARRQ